MARSSRWVSTLLLAAAARAAPVPGEVCAGAPVARGCSAAQDWAILIDNSLSTAPLRPAISASLHSAVNSFALSPASANSPRLMLISFDEPSNRPCA